MTGPDPHADAVRDFFRLADCYRLEGELLRDRGFLPERVVGTDSVVWRSPSGQLHTTTAAIEASSPADTIPDRKGST